jgi:hypothetical protein
VLRSRFNIKLEKARPVAEISGDRIKIETESKQTLNQPDAPFSDKPTAAKNDDSKPKAWVSLRRRFAKKAIPDEEKQKPPRTTLAEKVEMLKMIRQKEKDLEATKLKYLEL